MPTRTDLDAARRKQLIKCIKMWREKREIDKRELARMMRMGKMWVQRVEDGKVKRIDVIEFLRLADVCRFNAGAVLNRIRRVRDCC